MNINIKIVVALLSVAASIIAVVLGVSIGAGEILIPSLVAAALVTVFLISRPTVAAAAVVATFSCGLTVPGLPGQMKLSDAIIALLVGIYALNRAMKSGAQVRFGRLDWVLVVFVGWIFLIGYIRGFGFLFFGDSMIGGFYYLRLFLTASLVITLPRIGIPLWGWKPALLLGGLLAPVTLLADLLVLQGWAADAVRTFVQTTNAIVNQAQVGGDMTDINRLWSAGPAANGMLLTLLCLVPMRRFFQFTGVVWLALFAVIVTLSLMSGFRLMTATLFLVAALTLLFQKELSAPRLLLLFIAGFVGLGLVYFFSRDFPSSIQRAVSWLPGIDVSDAARSDAEQTIDWRLRLWAESIRYFPDYWLVGKGFSYEMNDSIAAFQVQYTDDLKWAIVMGGYHNGWLSMVLCTGVIGMVLCLILLIMPVIRHLKRHSAHWNSPTLKRYHGVFLAALTANAIVFLVVYGDVHASFPYLFFEWAVLEALSRTDLDAAPGMDVEDVYSESTDSTYQT